MNMDPDMLKMVGNILAVNVVAMLLLAVLSVAWSHLLLNALAWLDRWLDSSRNTADPGEDAGS